VNKVFVTFEEEGKIDTLNEKITKISINERGSYW